jgi:hypothetical protein
MMNRKLKVLIKHKLKLTDFMPERLHNDSE